MNKFTINLGSTIPGRFGAIILLGLAVLSLAGCGGGGSGNNSGSNMQIRPPSGNGPDLVIQSISVSDNTLMPSQRFTLSVTVRNQGNQPGTLGLVYRVNRDLPIDSSSTAISFRDLNDGTVLNPSQTVSKTIDVEEYYSTPGTYYYGACVTGVVPDETNTNNNCSGARVTVIGESTLPSGEPDLVIQSNSVSDNPLTPGQAFTLSVTVRNQGNGQAPATTLRYKRHANLPIVTSDQTVGTDSVTSLDPSRTSSESIRLTAPSTPGTYYYGACVDAVSGESNTSNNCSGNQGVRVTVRAQSTSGFGAFAFTWNAARTYAWGFGSGSTRSVAESNAGARCRLHGGQDCTTILWFSNQCGALAVGTDGQGRTNVVRAATGATKSAAESNAIQSCRGFGGLNCRIDSTDDAQAASFCVR